MNLQEEIKKEIYEHVAKFNLSEDEIKEIDTYVLDLLNNFKFLLKAHDAVLNTKEDLDKFKKMILENIRE